MWRSLCPRGTMAAFLCMPSRDAEPFVSENERRMQQTPGEKTQDRWGLKEGHRHHGCSWFCPLTQSKSPKSPLFSVTVQLAFLHATWDIQLRARGKLLFRHKHSSHPVHNKVQQPVKLILLFFPCMMSFPSTFYQSQCIILHFSCIKRKAHSEEQPNGGRGTSHSSS